jgi:hypothetical protein
MLGVLVQTTRQLLPTEEKTMNHRKLYSLAAIISLAVLPLGFAVAGDSAKDTIGQAESAAPAAISGNATIMTGDGTVLREGSNGWICMPDMMPGDGAPMCNDAVWTEMLGAVGSKSDFKASRIGVSYMLQGDYGAGVSNSDPYHPDPKSADDYVETGPHLMIVVPRELLEGITDDPSTGGPYVMWKDTPYAHLMVPVAAK